ncbi:DUF4402 domain-containing protein [Glaciimonas immobilis]|uniref:DUF4402 domain-containing protein n=1 Tax=Glaciimonas immobilis TaxID=728004 RepID=UPI001ADD4181|nr:DUF4402 domain-containing protein [Glaciimonas immobilis]
MCTSVFQAQAQTQVQSLTNVQALSFGSFAAGYGGGVTISAAGLRSKTGDVILLSSDNGSAGQFTVNGLPNQTYSIVLPANGTVLLTSGTSSMTVNYFTSKPSLTGTLSLSGTQTLAIGATLGIANNQKPGVYNGTFAVTANYN